MISRLAVALALVVAFGRPALAHNLDEYLQASLISLEQSDIRIFMRLVPGIAVLPAVLAGIDTNSDGAVSASEQQAYAARVLRDLSVSIDGHRLELRLLRAEFPAIDRMRQGLGEIRIELVAALPPAGSSRKLVFENHHQRQISAYLVNCLVPQDRSIQILTQSRNETQSFYELEYQQANSK